MELCNRVNEWLEQDPPPDMTKIPDSLADHIKTCSNCSETVDFFRNCAKIRNITCLSKQETGEFMKSFQKEALVNSQKSSSEALSMSSIFDWLNMKRSFALGMTILLLIVVFFWFFNQASVSVKEKAPSFASLNGNVTIISTDGKGEQVASNVEQVLVKEERIEFDANSEPVEIKYQNGGKVFLTGSGKMKVLKNGLNVENGKFNADFKNLSGVLKVRVPCAVLAVRGTEIHFDIHPPAAEIMLVEGAVDLIPDDTSRQTIQLETGKRVVLSGNIWTISKPGLQDIRKDEPPKLIAPDQNEEKKWGIPEENGPIGREGFN